VALTTDPETAALVLKIKCTDPEEAPEAKELTAARVLLLFAINLNHS